MIELKDVFSKLGKNKKNLILIICSVLALVLLLASEFTSSKSSETTEKINGYVSSTEYIKAQEKNPATKTAMTSLKPVK